MIKRTSAEVARREAHMLHLLSYHRAVGLAFINRLCHVDGMNAGVPIGKEGRLVIPADIRAALGLQPGDELKLHVDGSQLAMERPLHAVKQLRRLGGQLPQSRLLVDELLAERRLAADVE